MNARKMFESLSYEYQPYRCEGIKNFIFAKKDETYMNIEYMILFDVTERTVKAFVCVEESNEFEVESKEITVDEIKAINQQIKELGWLDE